MITTKSWIARGVIEAPIERVFAEMLAPHKVDGVLPPNTHYFNVDMEHHVLTLRGHYWYEGIFTVERHERGAIITYRVNNIGPQSHILPKISKWMVPIWQYKLPKQMKQSLGASVKVIAKTLQSAGYLVQ